MKTMLMTLAVAVTVAACGGDGDSDHTPPTATPDPVSACGDALQVKAGTTWFGVTPSGQTGRWHFDAASLSSSYVLPDASGTSALTLDAATCSFTMNAAGGLRAAFLPNGLGIAAVNIGGVNAPVMLVSSPEKALDKIAGTYNLVRKMQVGPTALVLAGGFQVDAAGNWGLCQTQAYADACPGRLSGTLVAESDGRFDIVMDIMGAQQVHGTLLAKGVGASKFLSVAIDNGFNTPPISGIWFGSTDSAFAAGAPASGYLTNSSTGSTDVVTLTGTKGMLGKATLDFTLDQPQPGVATVAGGDPGELALLSGLGLFATVGNADAGGSVRFGVKRLKP